MTKNFQTTRTFSIDDATYKKLLVISKLHTNCSMSNWIRNAINEAYRKYEEPTHEELAQAESLAKINNGEVIDED